MLVADRLGPYRRSPKRRTRGKKDRIGAVDSTAIAIGSFSDGNGPRLRKKKKRKRKTAGRFQKGYLPNREKRSGRNLLCR